MPAHSTSDAGSVAAGSQPAAARAATQLAAETQPAAATSGGRPRAAGVDSTPAAATSGGRPRAADVDPTPAAAAHASRPPSPSAASDTQSTVASAGSRSAATAVDAASQTLTSEPASTQTGPFESLTDYVAIPRLSGLAISPDGGRLVTSVSTLSADRTAYASALWELDPMGDRAPTRLTRSAPGESQPAFLPDGRLIFTSKRPDPDSATSVGESASKSERPALWLLPAGAGEASRLVERPGGVNAVAVARDAGQVAFIGSMLPGATDTESDADARKARKDAGVTGILHERTAVRYWDHDLGPDESRVYSAGTIDRSGELPDQPSDLTPTPHDQVAGDLAVSPDGRLIAYGWRIPDAPGSRRESIIIADRVSGRSLLIVDDPEADFGDVSFSPDSRSLVCVRQSHSSYDEPPHLTLWLVDLTATGSSSDNGLPVAAGRNPCPALTVWPSAPTFSASGDALFFIADEQGRAPIFRLDLATGEVQRLTGAGAHTDLVCSADGAYLYALRSSWDRPPHPVRYDPTTTDQDGVLLPTIGTVDALPGHLTEITTNADDGTAIRSWLALPHDASAQTPAPLLLWIHGGPLGSWNAWSWRWNPWLLVSRGYAVLLPDPALSTGYGQDFVRRGWGSWGARPFTDLMAATDAACSRADIDAERTAAMGGSFGGYMANWVATHTDRFRAIVTHASLWHLDQFAGTTDMPSYWHREFGDPLSPDNRYDANTPHRSVDAIRTPMLVIHGDRDYRVPIGEGLRLWNDLQRYDVDAKFLYFPNENHWVLTPGNAIVWYETVRAFLAQHVLGAEWKRPELL